MKKDISKLTFERKMAFDLSTADADTRTIQGASVSSDLPVMEDVNGYPTNVRLMHEAGSIVKRKDKIPMLWQHDMREPIGVIENVRIDNGKARGDFRFSTNARATDVWNDIQGGFLSDTSVKWQALEADEEEDGSGIRVDKWLFVEGSVVTVGADQSVGFDRSLKTDEGSTMTDTTETPNNGETPKGDSVVVDIQLASKRAMEKGAIEGQRAERKRVSDINSIFEFHQGDHVRTLQSKCIDDGLTLVQSQRALLQMLGGQSEPLATDFRETGTRNSVSMGQTDVEKTMNGIRDVLYKRAGLGDDIDVSDSEFMGLTLAGMARESLRIRSVNMRGMTETDIVGHAFARDVTETVFDKTVADFPNILADVANKSLLKGYNESEESWMAWCGTGSLPDFKTGNRPNLSLYPTPQTVAENGAFQLADMTDWNETIVLKTVGSIFSITRQAIVNDDLSAFTRIPRAQGRAAARSVGDTVYAQLTAVATMGDTNPLFDAVNHTNVYTAGAPSVATVDEIRTGMALQADPSGTAIGIRPAYLICPLALEGVATTLRNAQFDPDTAEASGNTAGNRPNWVAGTFTVVPEHRLDANSATIWYMTASQSIYDTVEVDFLNGVNAPMLESRDGFKIDGVEMKVRLDYGVAPLDWRTMAINGAAPV